MSLFSSEYAIQFISKIRPSHEHVGLKHRILEWANTGFQVHVHVVINIFHSHCYSKIISLSFY